MAKNPIGWFEIYVNDISRAKLFYESVFSVQLQKLGDPTEGAAEMMMFPSNMEAYGATGALVKMDGMPAGGHSTIIYFESEDCSVEEARVVAAGGEIQQPKMSIGEFGFCTLATDSEGNVFGIHSMK